MKLSVLSTVLFVATAGLASAQSYVCVIKPIGEGFIPEQLGMNIDKERKTAIVFDAFINWAEGKPISAKVRNTAKGDLEIRWNVTLPTSPLQARVRYRVAFNEAQKTMVMSGTIRNATNRLAGTGTCAEQNF